MAASVKQVRDVVDVASMVLRDSGVTNPNLVLTRIFDELIERDGGSNRSYSMTLASIRKELVGRA